MPSTYTSNNKIQKIATGEQSGTWGSTTNTNFDLFDTAIDGFVAVAVTGTTTTLNIPDGSAADGRNKVLSFTGTLSAANTVSVTPNTVKKHYFVQNNTTGSQNIIIYQGSGSTVTIKPGYSSVVYLDGAGGSAAAKEVLTSLKLTALLEATGAVFVGSTSGSTTLQSTAVASGTLTLPAATDTLVGKATTDTFTNKTLDTAGTGNVLRINGTQVSAVTGTGSVVLATSPTLVTPAIGTPTSGTLTSCTGLPISTGVSGLGSGVATFLATPSSSNLATAVTDETGTGALVFATSPTLVTPLLGTPTSGTLTNATGLPISTGVSGLGTGVATFLATPSSANLAAALTDETGTGSNVFATSPTLVTPLLGTPTSGTLTNCTGLPVSTGVSGLGTGVATFLATPSSVNLASAVTDETGSGALVFATSPTLATPLLGTPTSGTLTNCTGLPVSTGVSGLATGVATFLATPSSANLAAALTDETGTGANVFATSPTLVTPLLGTPTSGTLTSCTGLPISTGVSGLGTSVATFLATPSSANLAAALTDETGTGANVFATSPTIVTPTVTTSAVIPLVNGGTAVSSTLTLQSTSGAGTSDAIIFNTASQSERMRIDNSGRVGVGASSPSNASSKLYIQTAATIGTQFEMLQPGFALALLGNKASDNNFYITNDYDSTGLGVANRSITLTKTGEVGIGTTSPATVLEVVSTSGPAVTASTYSTTAPGAVGGYFGQSARGTVSAPTASQAGDRTLALIGRSYGVTTFVNHGAFNLYCYENQTEATRGSYITFDTTTSGAIARAERMRIDHNGNVGIGTTSLGAKLIVSDSTGSSVGSVTGVVSVADGSFATGSPRFMVRNTHATNNGASLELNGPTARWAIGQDVNQNGGNNFFLVDRIAGLARLYIDSSGNVKVGGTADRATTAGTNQLVIFNGTAPVGTLASGCSFYSTAGEMRVMDAAGNATLLSPHDSKTNEWIYDSAHTPSGKRLKINVEKLLRFINDHFGLDCVHDLIEEA